MVEHQPSKLDTWVRFPSPAFYIAVFSIFAGVERVRTEVSGLVLLPVIFILCYNLSGHKGYEECEEESGSCGTGKGGSHLYSL